MPEYVTATVAPNRSLVMTLKWSDSEGAEHVSATVLYEGDTVELPAPMISAIRTEGVIL
ncbi:MAG: hypothetical protein ACRYGP_17475 [Janthinobacterium lividum]